jgi:hypothetical protein
VASRVPADIKRLFVRVIAAKVAALEYETISKALDALALARFDQLESGELVTGRSGDGFSGTFAVPNAAMLDGITPAAMGALVSELYDLRDSSEAFLTKVAKYGLDADEVDENGWPNPLPAVVDANPTISQADIADRMLAGLFPKTESAGDFSQCGVQGVFV